MMQQHPGQNRTRRTFLLGLTVIAAASLAAVGFWRWKNSHSNEHGPAVSQLVGSASCAECHPTQYSLWLQSNHRHAMEIPSNASVLGDFNNAEFRYFGRTTRFSKDSDSFRITTENQQGQTETFKVAYTLGFQPLQQYLVDVGGGRIQALPFAWDTREKKDGGQRWFHLYPKENVTPSNPLFWTRPMQNWNHMCADCHTTGYSKNFSDKDNTFASHWNETGNGCESCHGAGSTHIEAMKRDKNKAVGNSTISSPRTPNAQFDQCGVCHARRLRLQEPSTRVRLLDTMFETWRPQLPQDPLYFVDGQIREEVFEIGSFLQSKMAAKGVRCTDCHDPHTARLKAEGNNLCTQCHKQETFDSAEHHFHKPGSAGAQCVSCHMPSRTYMIVDPRRDHRLAIPRPDLSDTLATPNPCASCHMNRTNSWAAEEIRKRVVSRKGPGSALAEIWGLSAWQASQQRQTAKEILNDLSIKPALTSANPISKAAVLASLKTLTPESVNALASQLNANEPLIRVGAIEAAGKVPFPQRIPLLVDLLHDPNLGIRLAAASLLAGTDKTSFSEKQRAEFDAALNEFKAWLSRDVDRAETLASLAALQAAEGDVVSAMASFEKALQRDETSLTVLLNFADFHRAQGNDSAAEPLLGRASALYPEAAAVHFALGLLRVRQKRTAEAVSELSQASRLSPDESHYAYVYAVSLYTTGQTAEAFRILGQARERFPANAEISSALRAYCAEQSPKNRSSDNRIAAACAGF